MGYGILARLLICVSVWFVAESSPPAEFPNMRKLRNSHPFELLLCIPHPWEIFIGFMLVIQHNNCWINNGAILELNPPVLYWHRYSSPQKPSLNIERAMQLLLG